ncbi:Release factor glutamine methyltransferase [Rosistilla carotiformis]|uniref:Release factor glutamine methyltransferase n=1 Tax=Rosistilla carotiformis TaxID=2528017 RepID=A0A518JMR9_9BACT|nr:peptide chain release factor N(5)-glutamine methyltransferase [Rosistilla carotiformis]QDV66838.1 Release factor glutamine methyltransferase [Rosistilla carotiformis]
MSAEQAEKWTILRLLEWTTEYFGKSGSDSPRLDAELLLSEARGCERIELYTAFNEEPGDEVRTAFRELVRRRGEGTPVSQLLGRKEFYSLSFRVSEDTLIPRPETEHLVIEALDEFKRQGQSKESLQIADVGTGSGIIAICLAKNLPNARFTAIDISAAALRVAETNAAAHKVQDRIQFIEGDLLAKLPETPTLDMICSNPPYVSEAEYAELDKSVRDFEPRQALVGGPDGTETIVRLIAEALPRLKPGGRLIFELSPMIVDQVIEHLAHVDAAEDVRVIKDLAGHKRIVSVARSQ